MSAEAAPLEQSEPLSVHLSLTREEADVLLLLLLRVPETKSFSAERIEQMLFCILRKIPTGGRMGRENEE